MTTGAFAVLAGTAAMTLFWSGAVAGTAGGTPAATVPGEDAVDAALCDTAYCCGAADAEYGVDAAPCDTTGAVGTPTVYCCGAVGAELLTITGARGTVALAPVPLVKTPDPPGATATPTVLATVAGKPSIVVGVSALIAD